MGPETALAAKIHRKTWVPRRSLPASSPAYPWRAEPPSPPRKLQSQHRRRTAAQAIATVWIATACARRPVNVSVAPQQTETHRRREKSAADSARETRLKVTAPRREIRDVP